MFYLLLILIFLRPFVSQLLFPTLDLYYSSVFLTISLLWLLNKKSRPFRTPLNYTILFFFSTVLLSCFLSTNISKSLRSIYPYLTYLFAFYLAAHTTEKQRRQILLTIFFSAAIISFVALYQYIFGFQIIWELLEKIRPVGFNFAKKYLEQKRIFSTFVTPTVFAGYLILIIPLIAGYLYDKKRELLYQPLTYLAIVLGGCLFLTKSVGAFLSLFFALSLFFILTGNLDKKTLFLFLAGFSVILIILIILRNYLRPETLPVFRETIIQRQMYWHDTWEIIKKYPFRGTGLGNFSISGTKFTHNSYLQLWAEMGIMAIITYLWLVFTSLKAGFLRLKMIKLRDFPGQGILSGLLASLCAFLIHNFVDFTFFIPEIALHWWIFLGLQMSFYHSR